MTDAQPPVVVVGSHVAAFDRATGRERWRYDPDTPLKSILRFAFVGSRILLLDAKGRVHALSVVDGTLLGVVDLRLKGGHAMLTDGDRVYVLGERAIVALSLEGVVLWRTDYDGIGSSWGLLGLGLPGSVQQPDYSRD